MIRFDYPEVFLLALPLYFAMRRWGWQSGVTGWLRAAIVVLLLIALAIPRWNQPTTGLDVILVADRSRSMPGRSDQLLQDLIKDLESNHREGDRISVVTFGAEAQIERELSASAVLAGFSRPINTDGSDLNEAILTGLDRRTDPQRPARILVMSDGLYNGPSPNYAARRAREEGVPIDYREFDKPAAGDVAIESIVLPRETGPNEPFQFSVMVYADRDASGSVIVKRNGEVIAERESMFTLGMNRLIFRDWVQDGGMHQYSAELRLADDPTATSSRALDPIVENNQASGVVRVVAGQRVLLLTHDGQGGNLGRALQSGQISFDVRRASDHPLTLDSLDGYRAVILENVRASDLGRLRMERLGQFVEDVGGGLLMTGGRQSFATGGYYNSPLDELLPVYLHAQEESRRSRAAIAVVLDRSGSMSVSVPGGKTKMDMANLGTAECIRLLGPEDMVAVIAVDSLPHLIQPITRVNDAQALSAKAMRVQSMGGGIFVYSGLVAAGRELMKATDYATRHIILFSDANDSEEPGDYKNLIAKYANAGITISVIGLGTPTDADSEFLRDIARRGNGNIEFSDDPLDLPRLFTQDAMNITRNMFLTKESEGRNDGFPGRVVPEIRLLGEFADSTFPTVDGYNLTFMKPDATQGVVSQDENTAPWSAFWYRGLGRVGAIPLEIDGEYSGGLASWPGFEDFIITHTRWLLGEEATHDLYVSLVQDGLDALVQVELDPNRPNEQRGLTPQLVVIPPSSERAEVIEPEFVWIGPDTLQGRFRLQQQGTYRTLVKTVDRDFTRGPALTLPYSPEFMPRVGLPTGTETLQALAEISGGKARVNLLELFHDVPARSRQYTLLIPLLCVLSMLLLVVEIAGRRWGWWERLRVVREVSPASEKRPWFSVLWPTRHARPRKRKQVTDYQPIKPSELPPPTEPPPPVAPAAAPDVFAQAKKRAKDRMK